LVRTYWYGPYATVPIYTGPANPLSRSGRRGTDPVLEIVPKTFSGASTYWYLAIEAAALDDAPMKKRILATTLWFFAGWYGGAVLAWIIGTEAPIGLLVGLAAGAFVGLDPRHLLWGPSAAPSRARLSAAAIPSLEVDRLS